MAGGVLATKLPKLYGANDMNEFKNYLKNQYESTKFRLNDAEVAFIETQARFGTQIQSILKTVV